MCLETMLRRWMSSVAQFFRFEFKVGLADIGILYASPNFIIVNKHYDVLINSNEPNGCITVEHQLQYFFPHLVDNNVMHSFRFIHRLDFATSGNMCVALNKVAAQSASKTFETRLSQKYYLALVHGHVTPSFISIDKAIGSDSRPDFSHCMCTDNHSYCLKPRRALTLLIVLELGLYNGKPATKIMLKPITGRRHQLRLHCREVNHTIIGDYTYSQRQDISPYRMFLHAYRLILPTEIESIDVSSPDPFTQNDVRNLWIPLTIVNENDESIYAKFPDVKL